MVKEPTSRISAWIGAFCISLGCLCACRTAQVPGWTASLGYHASELVPIEIRDYGYPFIPVAINGKTIWLPLDTGNMVGLTLASSRLDTFALEETDRWRRLNSAGEVIGQYRVFKARRVEILNQPHDERRIYEFEHPTLPGLVGPQFLSGKRFTLDYQNKLLAISASPLPAALPGVEPISLVRSSQHPTLILFYGTIHGEEVLMELDTGKSRTVVESTLARELGLEKTANGVRVGSLCVGSHCFAVASAKEVRYGGIDEGLPAKIQVGVGSDLGNYPCVGTKCDTTLTLQVLIFVVDKTQRISRSHRCSLTNPTTASLI